MANSKKTFYKVIGCVIGIPIALVLCFGGFFGIKAFIHQRNVAYAIENADVICQTTDYDGFHRNEVAYVYGSGEYFGTFGHHVINDLGTPPKGWVNIKHYFDEYPAIKSECFKSASYDVALSSEASKDEYNTIISKFLILTPDGENSRLLLNEFEANVRRAVVLADMFYEDKDERNIFEHYNRIEVDITQLFDYSVCKVYGWNDIGTLLDETVRFRGDIVSTPEARFRVDLDESFVLEEYANSYVDRLNRVKRLSQLDNTKSQETEDKPNIITGDSNYESSISYNEAIDELKTHLDPSKEGYEEALAALDAAIENEGAK